MALYSSRAFGWAAGQLGSGRLERLQATSGCSLPSVTALERHWTYPEPVYSAGSCYSHGPETMLPVPQREQSRNNLC